VLYDPETQSWKDVVPEKAEPLEGTSSSGGKLFVTYLKDVTTRAYVYSLMESSRNEIHAAGLGTAGGLVTHDDKFVFYSFTSFNYPRRSSSTTSPRRNLLCFAQSIFPVSNQATTKPKKSFITARTVRGADVFDLQKGYYAGRQQPGGVVRLRWL